METERKWKTEVLKDILAICNIAEYKAYRKDYIVQNYIRFAPFEIRLRHIKPMCDHNRKDKYYLTIKIGKGLKRLEFETLIFKWIYLKFEKRKKAVIKKIRYYISEQEAYLYEQPITIDNMDGMMLLVIEKEFVTDYGVRHCMEYSLPNYLDKYNLVEVTDDEHFKNRFKRIICGR